MPSQTFDTYVRGLLRRDHPRAVPPNFVREALNVSAVRGRWRSRPGVRPVTGLKSSGIIRGGHTHYRQDGSRDFLSASGANLERFQLGGDPIILSMAKVPTAEQTRVDPVEGCRFLSVSSANFLTFIYDGVNPNLKWDGTELTRMGIVAPSNPPGAPTPIAGSVNPGQRRYVWTLWTQYHESNPSEPLTFTQVATGGERFASPVQGVDYDDPQVTAWKLYVTQAGGARYFFVGKADIGLTIDHTVADNGLGPTPLEEIVNDSPPGKFVALVEHKGIVFGVDSTDRNLVRFCHATEDYISPEGWPFGNTIPVSHGDGDEISVLVSFFEWLVVFKRRGTFAITGDLDNGFIVAPVLAAGGTERIGIGCIAPGGVKHLENEVIFPSRDAFYVIRRSDSLSGGLEAHKISDTIDELYSCANFALGAAASYNRKLQNYTFWGHG